jgi:hypothetical protein
MNDQFVAATSTWQLTTHRYPVTPLGFEPTISAGERPQNYALDRAVTAGTGKLNITAWICRRTKVQLHSFSALDGDGWLASHPWPLSPQRKRLPRSWCRLWYPLCGRQHGPQSFVGSRPAVCVITIGNCLSRLYAVCPVTDTQVTSWRVDDNNHARC